MKNEPRYDLFHLLVVSIDDEGERFRGEKKKTTPAYVLAATGVYGNSWARKGFFLLLAWRMRFNG
jgi:hypothetical protein